MSPSPKEDHVSEQEHQVKGEDVFLLDTNRISFSGQVDNTNITKLIALIIACAKERPFSFGGKKPRIYIHIDSPGGCLLSGLRAYDNMKRMSKAVKLVTIAEGHVCSAATLLFLAGTDRRATPNVSFLIHQLSSGVYGKNADIQDEAENCKSLMKKLIDIYYNETDLRRSAIKKLLLREVYINADQAKDYGIAGSITN